MSDGATGQIRYGDSGFFMLGCFTALPGVALAGYVRVHPEPRRFVPRRRRRFSVR